MQRPSVRPIFAVWTAAACVVWPAFARAQDTETGPGVLPPPGASQEESPAAAPPTYPATGTPELTLPLSGPQVEGEEEEIVPPGPASPGPPIPSTTGSATDAPLATSEEPLLIGDSADETISWYNYPVYWLGDIPWDTGIELGLNGSSGSSESVSFRAGGYIKRQSEFAKINMSGYYNETSAGGVTTQKNAQFDIRNDWLLDDSSPWTLFASGTTFYDDFKAFDVQVNANGGVGYRVLDEGWISFTGRMGGGAMREFGGRSDQWVPEALLGFDYEQQLTSTQKAFAKLEYFPEFEDMNEYRLVVDVGWEIALVQPSNLSLKISATERYDSTPDGKDPHLVNYSVLLIWKL